MRGSGTVPMLGHVAGAVAAHPLIIRAGEGVTSPIGHLATVHKLSETLAEGRLSILEHVLAAPRAPTAGQLQALASEFGIECHFDSVASLCEQFGLRFQGNGN